ncbi:MAG: hypothetical protein V7L01_19710 [Nostoc sp.]|uniref:hypothetical protein n=1 Tax=Nostoc sp. TaxID=1180 RepID=UPI002FF8D149
MFFRYANYTTCIRSDNFDAIEQEVTHLLEQEPDCLRIPQPPELVCNLDEYLWEVIVRQLGIVCFFNGTGGWIVGLFPGKGGWTIVKTWPVDLLCARAEGASRPRLSTLAMELGCDTFHFWVTRDINCVLLEADATGRIFISGSADDEEGKSYKFYDEQIDAPDIIPQFSLLEVSQSMQAAMRVYEDPEIARIEVEYERLLLEAPDSELLFNLEDEVFKGYAERIDNALAEVIDKSKSWYVDLAYDVYTKPQSLEAKGVLLLYFQPPTTYNPHPFIVLPPEPLSEDDEDESF